MLEVLLLVEVFLVGLISTTHLGESAVEIFVPQTRHLFLLQNSQHLDQGGELICGCIFH